MSKVVAAFLDRLVERLTGLIAGLVSSRVAGFQAEAQAEQQSQLEDLARQYEADGKPTIAATLRQRAGLLSAPELAAEGETFLRRLTAESGPPTVAHPASQAADLRNLPDFGSMPPKQRKKRHSESPFISTVPTPNYLTESDGQEPQA